MIRVNSIKDLDVKFDFTSDSPGYWDGFWDRGSGHGGGGCDPDSKSKTLKSYHRLLWSKQLPNGEMMKLEDCQYYLHWEDLYFGSDSITATFRYARNIEFMDSVKDALSDYRLFIEDFLHKSYTIGGMIIFPQIRNSMNQRRGCSNYICDRWDLTLECIRRYYAGEDSPLANCINNGKTKIFFDKFVDFKGYVDFFFLQDCVDENYNVKFWLDTSLFEKNPIPKSVEGYLEFIHKELDFVKKRNARILDFINGI